MKKAGQLSISLGLTLLIGFVFYRGVPDWGHALRVMVQGRVLYLLIGFGFSMLHMVLRAARWGVLLKPVKRRITYRNLFSLTLVKYVINIIPPRTGEVVASILLARREKISAASVIAASLLERILDTGTVVVLFCVYLVSFSQWYSPDSELGKEILLTVRNFSIKGFLVLVVLFVVVRLVLHNPPWMKRVTPRLKGLILPIAFLLLWSIVRRLHWIGGIPQNWRDLGLASCFVILWVFMRRARWLDQVLQKVGNFFPSFLEGFRALQQGGALAWTLLLSLAIWLVITLQMWFMVQAYLDGFPFTGALFLMCITVVGIAIPTPGGVGGYQIFMNVALVNFFSGYMSASDPNSQAAGISNGCYITSMVPVILIGVVFLYREGLSLGRISQISEREAKQDNPVLGQ
jgi:uncharacterized membrane protein YbhN (UPF0104 family)